MSEIRLIDVEDVVRIHKVLTGSPEAGLVDRTALLSAVGRQWTGYGDNELYPDLASKAGAVLHGIIQNHPFVDGNKRTGLVAAAAICRINGFDLVGTTDTLVDLATTVADGSLGVDEAIEAVRRLIVPLQGT